MQLFKEHLGLLNNSNNDPIGVEGYRQMKHADIVVMDPLHDEFYYDIWDKTAEKNTIIYRDVFRCVPDDTGSSSENMNTFSVIKSIFFYTVHSVEQQRQFVPDPSRILPGHVAEPWNHTNEEIQTKLDQIRGHLVQFPTEYLKNVNLNAVMQDAALLNLFT